MADKRFDLLGELYTTMVSEKEIRAVTFVSAVNYEENKLHYQYLESKGYITVMPVQSDGTIGMRLEIDGISFYEDVKDIAPSYWRK